MTSFVRITGKCGRMGFFARFVAVAAWTIGLTVAQGTAQVGSDRPGAVVIFPKIVVSDALGVDTLIRLTNTSMEEQNVHCFYVNVTPRCSRPGFSCYPDPDVCELAGGSCSEQWQETDFQLQLTGRQPTSWLVSLGEDVCRPQFDTGVCSDNPATVCQRNSECGGRCVFPPCLPLTESTRKGPRGQTNEGKVPVSPEEPFLGELKCIAVDPSGAPIGKNALKGEALIARVGSGGPPLVITGYNAIGIPAIDGTGNRDATLVIGGPGAEYEGCPNILILDHVFDGAVDPLAPSRCNNGVCAISSRACTEDDDCPAIRFATDLALIPCTEDFRNQNPDLSKTVAQFLVFNEFEQRFSTSRTVKGFREDRISNLDTPQNERSIFSAGVAGTFTGQSRIRGVNDGASDHGNTLLGIFTEYRCVGPDFPMCSFVEAQDLVSAVTGNLHFDNSRRARSDFIYLPE